MRATHSRLPATTRRAGALDQCAFGAAAWLTTAARGGVTAIFGGLAGGGTGCQQRASCGHQTDGGVGALIWGGQANECGGGIGGESRRVEERCRGRACGCGEYGSVRGSKAPNDCHSALGCFRERLGALSFTTEPLSIADGIEGASMVRQGAARCVVAATAISRWAGRRTLPRWVDFCDCSSWSSSPPPPLHVAQWYCWWSACEENSSK